MEKGYVSNRYPGLSIGPHIQFRKGLFVTDDPALQKVVEGHAWWKIHIHPQKSAPPLTEDDEARIAEPVANLGMKGTGKHK